MGGVGLDAGGREDLLFGNRRRRWVRSGRVGGERIFGGAVMSFVS
jgi:hypothetical protein